MATAAASIRPLPFARPASVDAEFGSTLTAQQVKISGPQYFRAGNYLIVGSATEAGQAPAQYAPPDIAAIDVFYGNTPTAEMIVSERTIISSGSVNAATMSRPVTALRPHQFYADLQITSGEYWWTGDSPSVFVSFKLHDRRLAPFFDRLARIEEGEWDPGLGRLPSKTALAKTRAVLKALSGGPITPKKVIGGDGLVVIYFTTGEKYSNIEIHNNGSMVVLTSDGQAVPQVRKFTLEQASSTIDQIRAYLA